MTRLPPSVLRAVAQLLAPERCLACRRRAAPPWCRSCEATLPPPGPACPRCAGPSGAAHRCWSPDGPIASTVALHDYRGVVARALVTAKMTGARSGWEALGERLAERLAADEPEVDAVTWVTTAPSRRRRRGLDHAEVLARVVAARLGLPAVRLLDVRAATGQADVARAALPGTEVLLVDDILTTGRTAAVAAGALQAAGAGNVRLAFIARAGTHELAPAGLSGPRPRRRMT
jgi:predicted amidophosphoribosyltransferase